MSFEKAVEFALSFEGGYSNDPVDPGGETNYGISKRAYPTLDIKNLTREDAVAIYRRDYWDACGCDSMAGPLATCVFDTAVNCGKGRAKQWLALTHDYNMFLDRRKDYYLYIIAAKPSLGKFKNGWLRRVDSLRKLASSLEPEAH